MLVNSIEPTQCSSIVEMNTTGKLTTANVFLSTGVTNHLVDNNLRRSTRDLIYFV